MERRYVNRTGKFSLTLPPEWIIYMPTSKSQASSTASRASSSSRQRRASPSSETKVPGSLASYKEPSMAAVSHFEQFRGTLARSSVTTDRKASDPRPLSWKQYQCRPTVIRRICHRRSFSRSDSNTPPKVALLGARSRYSLRYRSQHSEKLGTPITVLHPGHAVTGDRYGRQIRQRLTPPGDSDRQKEEKQNA